jgi:hypothetical protein
MAFGTMVHGKFLDWDYRRISKDAGSDKVEVNFPIEKVCNLFLPRCPVSSFPRLDCGLYRSSTLCWPCVMSATDGLSKTEW